MDLFWVQLGLSFVVGALWVTLTTMAAERFGTKLGGLIGGLPSTSIVSFFFIGWTQGVQATIEATSIAPLALSFSGVFIIIFATLSQKGLARGLVPAIVTWLVLAGASIYYGLVSFWWGMLACTAMLFIVHYYLEHHLSIKSVKGAAYHPTSGQILFRAVFGGTIIGLAVYLSKVGGPWFGGVFGMFPAMYTSTLLILGWSKGVEFARATTKSLMLTGFVSLLFFTTAVRYGYPVLGLWWGTAFAYLCSLIVAIPTYHYILRMK